MNQSRKLAEGAMMLGIYIVLLVAAILVPVLNIFVLFVLPVPFSLYAAKYNWKPGLLVGAGAMLLSLIIVPPVTVPLTFVMVFGGLMIGSGIYQKTSPYETLARGTAGFAVGIVLVMAAAQLLFGVNLLNLIDQTIGESVHTSETFMKQFGAESSDSQVELIKQQAAMVKELIPSSLVVVSILFALFIEWLTFKLLNRFEKRSLRFPPFRDLRLPSGIIWFYLIAVIFVFADLGKGGIASLMATNVLMILELLILLQGLSFLFYYSYLKKISRVWPVIVTIVALILPPITYIVRFIGIIDVGMRLRDRIAPK